MLVEDAEFHRSVPREMPPAFLLVAAIVPLMALRRKGACKCQQCAGERCRLWHGLQSCAG
jgi:hypothetical protein